MNKYRIKKLLAEQYISIKEAEELFNSDKSLYEQFFKDRESEFSLPSPLSGAFLFRPKIFKDQRGYFFESYSKKRLLEQGIKSEFVQDNQAFSKNKGVLRGLHFQLPPHSQAKLVRVNKGSVYDVIVDIRKNSKTYGCWEGFTLSAKNRLMLYIPKGFAHGYCTLEDNTEFLYKTDNFYEPTSEGGLLWDDSDLKIDWPTRSPIIAEKDRLWPALKDLNKYYNL
jgi:dTDP-4-dehydrorhamnose 3,5-epimerase